MDAETGDEVGPSEIIKGYEVGKGHTSRSSPQHTWGPRCEKAVDRRHHNFSYERPKDNISIILLAERKAFTAKIVNRHEAVEAAKRNAVTVAGKNRPIIFGRPEDTSGGYGALARRLSQPQPAPIAWQAWATAARQRRAIAEGACKRVGAGHLHP